MSFGEMTAVPGAGTGYDATNGAQIENHVKRRSFLATACAALFLTGASVRAQQPGRRYRVGMLLGDVPSSIRSQLEKAFLDELGRRGFVDGRNLDVRWMYVGDTSAQARELITFRPDVLVSAGTTRTRMLQSLTKTIPIVFVAGDPVAGGLVKDLVKPGGNTTGVSGLNCELMTKQLELVRELVPRARSIVVIDQSIPGGPCAHTAETIRQQVKAIVSEKESDDAARTIQAVMQRTPDAIVNEGYNRDEINNFFALKHHVPIVSGTMSPGVLVALHQHHVQVVRRHAELVARILNGAKPGELPVEFPREVQMEVDLRLGRQIGIQIPESILLRADRVIE